MCTLIALWRCHPAAPLVLALNRDEFLARPASPVELWRNADPPGRIVSGRDLQAGGTWFGVGERVVAGLTNHRAGARSKPGERSRGELVVRALCASDANAVRDELQDLAPTEFGLFHLLAADAETMIWATNRSGTSMEIATVEPGIHVLGNYGLDNPEDPVVRNVGEALKGALALDEAALRERLKEILCRRGPGWPLVDLGPYGTRSSAILFWGGASSSLFSADGPPDSAAWKVQDKLLGGPPRVS